MGESNSSELLPFLIQSFSNDFSTFTSPYSGFPISFSDFFDFGRGTLPDSHCLYKEIGSDYEGSSVYVPIRNLIGRLEFEAEYLNRFPVYFLVLSPNREEIYRADSRKRVSRILSRERK